VLPDSSRSLDDAALAVLFTEARSYNGWKDTPVDDAALKRLHEILRMAPTSANCQPARFVFVRTPEAKARLLPCLMEGNRAKTETAPVTAIVAYDLTFPETMPHLFPHTDAKSWFEGNEAFTLQTATLNSTLQVAYLILAARAMGLDCGPMTGFDVAKVDAEFLADTPWHSSVLVNLGYGDPASLFPRSPRPDFDDVCRLI